jgi:type VI secretion system secreted protein Hcp
MPTVADALPDADGADMFLDLTLKRAGKVKGESSSPGHVDDITVLGLGWGVASPHDATTGQARGRRSYRNLVVHKALDTSSTGLMTAVAANDEVRRARLCLRKAGGEQVDYCTITLEKARIVAYDLDVNPGGRPIEKVSFSFQKIEVEYRAQEAKGSLAGTCTFTDDLS